MKCVATGKVNSPLRVLNNNWITYRISLDSHPVVNQLTMLLRRLLPRMPSTHSPTGIIVTTLITLVFVIQQIGLSHASSGNAITSNGKSPPRIQMNMCTGFTVILPHPGLVDVGVWLLASSCLLLTLTLRTMIVGAETFVFAGPIFVLGPQHEGNQTNDAKRVEEGCYTRIRKRTGSVWFLWHVSCWISSWPGIR